jgi:beta-lactamase regulating signal transducer with metallopeptidase domain
MSTFGLAFTSALLDFVWQGTLIALALQASLHTIGRRSAQVRYALSAAALAALIALPIVTTASRYRIVEAGPRIGLMATPFSVVPGAEDEGTIAVNVNREVAPVLMRLQPRVLPLWSMGVLLLSLRLIAGGLHVRALRRNAQRADAQWHDRLLRVAMRMGIRNPIQLAMSSDTEGPAVIGWLRPIIMLPPATVMGLTPDQFDAVLAHELAHIRRHDYLVNIVQMMAETLLFYHPAVWWVSRRLRIERELCCDDEAVRICGDASTYARALVTMSKPQGPAMAMATTGGSLNDRVRRLLGMGSGEGPRRSVAFGLTAIAVVLTSITIASVDAQREPARFEVASVHLTQPRTPSSQRVTPTRVSLANQSLWSLLVMAFKVHAFQLSGPDWLTQVRVDVQATIRPVSLPNDGRRCCRRSCPIDSTS